MGVPATMWAGAMLISFSSLLYGYTMSSLNNVMGLGDLKDPHLCFTGEDGTCPVGSILNSLDLDNSTSKEEEE